MLECAALILSPYDETLVSDLLVACYDSHTNLPSSYILRSTYNNTSHLTHSSPSHLLPIITYYLLTFLIHR